MTASTDTPSPEELIRFVAESSLFKAVERAHLDDLRDQLTWVTLDANETLFREGDVVDAFYFLVAGQLEVTKLQLDLDGNPDNNRLVLAEIGPGATIGEMQILTGGTRSATVSAKQPSGLVKFPKPAFDRLLAKEQSVVDALTRTIMPRLYRDQMVEVLPKLFGELDDQMLRDLEAKMSWVHLPRGYVLCYQGEPSDSFYIIISGRLEVLIRNASGESRQVGEMSQGEAVGEMGVFTGEPRSATILASRDSELLRFSKSEFDELTQRYPQLMRHLTRLLIKRLQQVEREAQAANLSANILLAPASDGATVDDFSLRLQAALLQTQSSGPSKMEPCLLLTSAEVDRRMGVPGLAQATENEPNDLRLRSWLSQQERRYRVILLQTDPTVTNWTRRCIRNADEIIYVAEADHTPKASAIVDEIQQTEFASQTQRRRAVVLLHDDHTERPRDTLPWLQELKLVKSPTERQLRTRHFHFRRKRDSDYQRLARYVSGREVGLVLSGGGARGFAHVGCLRAMRELNIPIDMIGGVSMGSLVSAAYAYAPEKFEETISAIKSKLKGALFDLTPPVVSIARGRRFDQRLQSWFGDTRIEDLWVPYFCVSSNLTEANIVVFDTDALWWAVRASGTLPGLTSPMIRDGCLLFDGCLLNNLPMDVMRERLGKSRVIAVDVVPPHDLKVNVTEVQSPSGWWLLWKKLTWFGPKVELPNIISIMRRSAELGSVYGRETLIARRLADIYLQPPVENIHIVDFAKVEESAAIGYEYCKEQLAEWWSSQTQ